MKKWIVVALLMLAGSSRGALLNWSGSFVTGSSSFIYDGVEFGNGWAIFMYQSTDGNPTFNMYDLTLNLLQTSSVQISSDGPSFTHSVIMGSVANISVPDSANVFSVLFNNATPLLSGGNYLLLDTLVRNVGTDANPVTYTPGNPIPTAGTVQFDGQVWQPVVIPEPATMGLMVLGGLALTVRRRIRK